MAGKLYVVGTPIGNLEDFSNRAIRTLNEVDFIAAEDTRVTLKLLNHFGIKKELVSYFEHNKSFKGDMILRRIENGENCAIVSDAGMPIISDPGEDLVNKAHESGIAVESVPGPTALITALCLSGMSAERFCFEGFLPVGKKERNERLNVIKDEERTMIFYEAPHKLLRTLTDMEKVFGAERKLSVIKEITKIHETVLRFNFSEALKYYSENEPKGEYVLIVAGKEKETAVYSLNDAVLMAKEFVKDGNSASSAAKLAAGKTGIKKGDIYKEIV